jgi:hypothetical protein
METSHKAIITVYAIFVAAVVCFALYTLYEKYTPGATIAFAAPESEAKAVAGTPSNVDDSLNYTQIAIGDELSVSMCGNLYANEDNTIDVYFTSDASNTSWVRLILLDAEGAEIASTGLVSPGEYVQQVELNEKLESPIEATVKILTYNPETYISEGSANASVMIYA